MTFCRSKCNFIDDKRPFPFHRQSYCTMSFAKNGNFLIAVFDINYWWSKAALLLPFPVERCKRNKLFFFFGAINVFINDDMEHGNHCKQDCIPVGCVPSAAVAMSIPACTGQGGVCPGEGVCPGGVYPSMHWGRHPLWTKWLTDRCKNITFPRLRLRTVKMVSHDFTCRTISVEMEEQLA